MQTMKRVFFLHRPLVGWFHGFLFLFLFFRAGTSAHPVGSYVAENACLLLLPLKSRSAKSNILITFSCPQNSAEDRFIVSLYFKLLCEG